MVLFPRTGGAENPPLVITVKSSNIPLHDSSGSLAVCSLTSNLELFDS